MIEVLIENEQEKVAVTDEITGLIDDVIRLALQAEGISTEDGEWEVAVTLVDNEVIRDLNREHRQIDRATDVLSFPLEEELYKKIAAGLLRVQHGIPLLLGDIVLSMPMAQRQATDYGHSLEREIGFLTAHGLLHLLGYDHQEAEEEQVMLAKQENVLSRLGLQRHAK